MLHTLYFSLQNAFYFIMLPFLVPVLLTFYIQFKCKTPVPKMLSSRDDGKPKSDRSRSADEDRKARHKPRPVTLTLSER
jgi:hypothetical protein